MGGDFVVWKAAKGGQTDGPAYQLAVVVDDHDQGVTEVVRGDDLLDSTPRQIHLSRTLGLRSPTWCHVPLVVGPDGLRLAKRHGDTRVAAFRRQKISPTVLCGFLAWSLGFLEKPEPCLPRDLLGLFSWSKIPRAPWTLTQDLLAQMGYRGS